MAVRSDGPADVPERRLLIFLVAGEPSGDVLGARLMAALKRRSDNAIDFAGVGGTRMAEEGLVSLFPMTELSVMGIAEILPKVTGLLRRIAETSAAIRRLQPDVIVTIDAPAFCIRVLKRLKGTDIPKIHYVAPTVWAWRPGRAKKFAAVFDRLMALLPFEPAYFERVGLVTEFVGHPVLEGGIRDADGARFRGALGIEPDVPLLCILPGSRIGEVTRLLPPFADAVARIHERLPNIQVAIPSVAAVADEVRRQTASWPVPVTIVEGDHEKYDVMAAANAAIAASGTVALELAQSSVPSVIGYRVHPLTAAIVRRLVRVKYANLVNILLDREAVPEFIQNACRGDLLADALLRLLTDKVAADEQRLAMKDAMKMLSAGDMKPSDAAAALVLSVAGQAKGETAP